MSRDSSPGGPSPPLDRRAFLAAAGGGVAALVTAPLLRLSGASDPGAGAAKGPSAFSPRLRFLTGDPAFVDTRPCFSPSGRTVLFMRSPAGDDPVATENSNRSPWSLWTVPTGGGRPRPFFEHPELRATRPDWCSSTGRIAFSGVREGRGELWLLDETGGGLTRVEVGDTHRGALFYPSWYPDGGSVAVTDYRRHRLLRVEVATGAVEPLTDPAVVRAGMSSVSPEAGPGHRVAFAGQRPGGPFETGRNSIWIRRADGRAEELLPGHGRMPWWSPDGRRLAFVSTRSRPAPATTLHPRSLPSGVPSVFTLRVPERGDPDASEPVGVSPLDHWTEYPRWSPDGSALVCRATELRTGRAGIALLDLGGRPPR